ncbi:hypothetical protein BDR03DRAFT_974611 [Suillus americanus]|nr:hypothetical protein BDR03DRAFT_974611 [Suillus americanus]
MANLDYFTKSTTNQQAVTDSLDATFRLYTDYDHYGCVYPCIFRTPSYSDPYHEAR